MNDNIRSSVGIKNIIKLLNIIGTTRMYHRKRDLLE